MPSRRLLALSVALLLVSLVPATARAEAAADRAPPDFSLRFNPVALAIGRTSGEAEVWVTRYVSVVGSVFHAEYSESGGTYEVNPGDINEREAQAPSSKLSLTGFEAGVRYSHFERSRGGVALGAFGGLSVGPAWGRWRTTPNGSGPSARSSAITQVTAAVEGGGMLLIGPLLVEVGVGLQATHDFGDDPKVDCGDAYICVSTTHWFYGSGFTPRILTSVGVAF